MEKHKLYIVVDEESIYDGGFFIPLDDNIRETTYRVVDSNGSRNCKITVRPGLYTNPHAHLANTTTKLSLSVSDNFCSEFADPYNFKTRTYREAETENLIDLLNIIGLDELKNTLVKHGINPYNILSVTNNTLKEIIYDKYRKK